MDDSPPTFVAFHGTTCLARGDLPEVLARAQAALSDSAHGQVLIFDARSSVQIDFGPRDTPDGLLARLSPVVTATAADGDGEAFAPAKAAGPGRPRLGVVAREVTLLPRHWEWLSRQSGGASVALRKLVDQARRVAEPQDTLRKAQESSYRFMAALAGDLPGYEEATRALFAGRGAEFAQQVAAWPADVRAHALQLAEPAFARDTETADRDA